jgi:limonene-1,2-epoxide hydrolase
VVYGAVTTSIDRMELRGHYYNFFWRTKQTGPLTVRFEYRQANLGSYVQAKEVDYATPKGTMETHFQVIGDDYLQDGRVISWRALLISDGKIVGLTQSYLWD